MLPPGHAIPCRLYGVAETEEPIVRAKRPDEMVPSELRALLIVRPNAGERLGGDLVAAEGALAAVRAAGVAADLVADPAPDPRGYDVAHLFGLFDPELQRGQFAALRTHRIPLVVSPIWWDRSGLFAIGPRLVRALGRRDPRAVERRVARLRAEEDRLAARAGRGAERWLAEQAALLREADVALPASELEAYACARTLRVLDVPYVVAPYGLDPAAFTVPRAPRRSGVLCVGRIERSKNQALLLFALRDSGVDVTLVGHSYDAEYLAACRRWASPRTRFVERLPLAELQRLYASAAVHVLPSFADLPGLVSLEAAAAGAHVVVGNRGSEREYLGADAHYVDPLDPASIRDGVLGALTRPPREPGDGLEQRLRTLRWDRHAETTIGAYRRAIALHR
jgi:glycosyltransferase involved in cell wall biosynthesis